MSKRLVALGFSGGVDSAVAAILLARQGYEVHGLFLDVGVSGAREDAQNAAAHLRLPLLVRDAREALDMLVCEPFACGYIEGRTLNPCLLCNRVMKLEMLARYADEIGAEHIATGHYAVTDNGRLYMGDPEKDQSYQLSMIKRNQLERLLLPLGGCGKPTARQIAREAGLSIADKPDSMDICFIPDHDYASWIEARVDEPPQAGNALLYGEPIARHNGVHRYTVGQRWHELVNERRLYVSKICPERNELELVYWDDLFKTDIEAQNMSWLVPEPTEPFRGRVRVRHTNWETPSCTVTPIPGGVRIHTDSPVRAPAPGQVAAIYVDKQVLGGGYIV